MNLHLRVVFFLILISISFFSFAQTRESVDLMNWHYISKEVLVSEIENAEQKKDFDAIAGSQINLALHYLSNRQYHLADSMLKLVTSVPDIHLSRSNRIRAYYCRGLVYADKREVGTAVDYFKTSAVICPDTSNFLVVIQEKLADMYFRLQEFSTALDLIDQAISKGDTSNLANQYLLKSMILVNIKNYSEAQRYAEEALQLFESQNNISGVCASLTTLGTNSIQSGIDTEGYAYYLEAYDIARNSNDFESLQRTTFFLSRYYEQTGRVQKSLDFYKLYSSYRDSLYLFSAFTRRDMIDDARVLLRQQKQIRKLSTQKRIGLYSIFLLSFTGLIIFFILRLSAKKRENQLLQKLHRVQINPHFIFNSLNTLQGYIIKNDLKNSNKYLTNFSKLIRSILGNTSRDFIPIAEENQFLESYLQLETLRFEQKFIHEILVSPRLSPHHVTIPTMIIQPFVENAIWHGLVPKDGAGKITIKWEQLDHETVLCSISDNGIGREEARNNNQKSSQKSSNLGTTLVKTRLDQLGKLYGKKFSIEYNDLYSSNGNALGTEVNIKIPTRWRKEI